MGNSECLLHGKPAATELSYPSNSDMIYGIFNVCADVHACDCAWGCMNTVRESALEVDTGEKIPGRTRESNLHRQRASLMLYQLSYIPTPLNRIIIFFLLDFFIF